MSSTFFRISFAGALGSLLAAVAAPAATLTFEAPLHLQPDSNSPVVAVLPAGSSVNALVRDELIAAGFNASPPGWVAIRFPGPLAGFVVNGQVGKDFALKPGAVVHAAPEENSPVITTITPEDRAAAIEAAGAWSKVAVHKETILFLNPLPPHLHGGSPPPAAAPTAAAAPEFAAETESSPAAAPAMDSGKRTPGESVVSSAAPRTFQGYLQRTRRFLGAGPKLDYQLVDENGRRVALLDLSSLLLTDPLDAFEDRKVTVYGPGLTREGVRDLIIRVETLRLTP